MTPAKRDDERVEEGTSGVSVDDLSVARSPRVRQKSGAFRKGERDESPKQPPTEPAKEEGQLISVEATRSHYVMVSPRGGKRTDKPER